MFKKIVALLIMVSFFYFVGATGVLASNNISVTVKTYVGNSTPAVSSPFGNQARGAQVSISHGSENGNGFAFFAVNDTIRPDLPKEHQFKVLSRMSISVIYDVRDNGDVTQHAVVFVDSNRRIIEVQYVAVGQLAVAPSLPTPPPNMEWKATPWLTLDNKDLEDVVNENRVYYAQYQVVDAAASYQLTVNGGTGSGSFKYNSVATVTPNTPFEGKVFSHWADAEGNKLSYKSTYAFTILGATTVQAVFIDGTSSPAELPVVSMSDDLGIKGSGFVTYKGQMQLPAGYTVVEYGFIFSRSSEQLTLESLGATIVPSNIHYGLTGEFMRSFPADTFNSVRAYMIVFNGVEEVVVYSENVVKYPSGVEDLIYQTGFVTKTGSNSTEVTSIVENYGDYNITWTGSKTYVETAESGLNPVSIKFGSSSARGVMTSPYVFTNLAKIEVSLKLYGTDSNKVNIKIGKSGSPYIQVQQLSLTSSFVTYSVIINLDTLGFTSSEALSIQIEAQNSSSNRFFLDDIKLYAVTDAIQHEVVYNNSSFNTAFVVDGQTISNTAPTQTGYSFAGWYTDVALTQSYNASSPVIQSLQLYAKWTINQYTITFNSAGGSSVDAITQDYNSSIDAPADPTREGYTFDGWSQAVPSNMPAADLTLTAQWLINQYTITFDSNEGSAVSPITQNFGTSVSAPVNPTREGYLFLGWFIDDVTFENEYVFSTMPSQNITLYANWEELVGTYYTVTFNSDGGTAVSSQQVIENGYAVLPDAPTKTGYTFVNWQDETNVVWDFALDPITEDMTLYATWTVVTYTITYSNLQDATHGNPATYSIETSTITLSSPSARSGYNFAGWFTALEGGSQVTQIVLGSTGIVALFARWIEVVPVQSFTETFANMTLSGTTYTSGSHTGVNGQLWSYTLSRGDQTLDGKALTTQTGVITVVFANGLSKLEFDYVRAFTGTSARSFEVWINGQKVATITVSTSSDTVNRYISENLDYKGEVTLEIKGFGAQKKIDNISWTTNP